MVPRKIKGEKDVSLALGYYDYRFHLGVAKYAREHRWHLAADMAYRRRIPTGWKGDGIIAKVSGDDALSHFIATAGAPVVNVGRGTGRKMALVLIDEGKLTQMAVEHFVERGIEHCVWFGREQERPARTWSRPGVEVRGDRFIQEVRKVGLRCDRLCWNAQPGKVEDTWINERVWLIGRLKALAKPVGIFCLDDAEAAIIVQACVAAGLSVPEDVAVLGVNNDELICDTAQVPISSIDTDMEGRAYRAAELLDQVMNGKTIPEITMVDPKCLVTRRSTDVMAIRHVGLARALRYIYEHSVGPISIMDIAHSAGMSTRGLHKVFVTHLHRPPSQEIQRVRIERAKRMLRDTNEKVQTVASEAGFASVKNLFRAFRRELHGTPTEYRDQHRKTSG